ncbi:MAG: hypothetical protein GY866_08615 [Proteobacteria bacterium]|nr:hypothetical protein [Pseudomonadota bacterium]
MGSSFPSDIAKTVSSAFTRLESIRDPDPDMTPENWCKIQPCVKIKFGSREIVLSQPSSSFFVYFLGILTIGAGLYFLWIRGGEISRLFWGVSLIFWGIGALLAGTSYQAFGYEIKCAGRSTCAWTSWWEVTYLMFHQASMSAMLLAVAYSCTEGWLFTVLSVYAVSSAVVYLVLTFIGGIVPIKSLITFELAVSFSTPTILAFLVLNGWRYHTLGDPMDLALLGTWIFLLLSMAAYRIYDALEIPRKLWAKGRGIWFSENDVLHICLILWVIYIATVVANRIEDYTALT